MSTSLSKAHRKLLENATTEARPKAEAACKAALENLAVHEKEARAHMSAEQRGLRGRLRSRGRALGDVRDERTGVMELGHLVELAAYEHWHRLLFTRFLTENGLLITDAANGNVPVTLEECEDLAAELGARDGLELACRFASLTLPGVFRTGDPVLELPIALNDQVELRKKVGALPPECFKADDALGWTYQFWQAKRKEEVNKSGKKIGADELSPVTQLFTEDYMVEFLLHNTLGAWWAGKLGEISGETEAEVRGKAGLGERGGVAGISWTYLRFVQDEVSKKWRPAAGVFEGWPRAASKIKLLDPSMGSGHFLVFALPILVRLRMEEEPGLGGQAAVAAVLRDNMFGLELDERCTQIAAFNVALTAWKLAGYQVLPPPNLACSGLSPSGTEAEWVALAGADYKAQQGMARLHRLFKDAPVLGSLINPRVQAGNLLEAGFDKLAPLLAAALAPTESDGVELAFVAQGLAKAAELLAGQFTLVSTNVPYLGRGKQVEVLQEHCERSYPESKADLATCFVERCLEFCSSAGTAILVTPQNWLSLGTYKKLRKNLLETARWEVVARLGPKGFQTPMWDFNVVLLSITKGRPRVSHIFCGIDVGDKGSPVEKAIELRGSALVPAQQIRQLENPDSRVIFGESNGVALLQAVAASNAGMLTGDGNHFCAYFWEPRSVAPDWEYLQSTVAKSTLYGGRSQVVLWEGGKGQLYKYAESVKNLNTAVQRWRTGQEVWGKKGVVVSCMGSLECTLYLGDRYDNNVGVISPFDPSHLAAIWAFCCSPEFSVELRRIDQKVNITAATFVKIPFDLPHWQEVAAEKYPDGLPKTHSNDPTQWLFNGHPRNSDQPLHVAVARLLGYRWPRQTGSSFPDCPALPPDDLEPFADDDGIVCLQALNREQPAAARLRQLLAAALGTFDERTLLASAGLKGSKSKTLEDWLRDEFFEQHAKVFHDRPFVWHLWDGLPDGFHALVHYHRLDHATLTKLTYSYLGNWIQQQTDDAKAEKPGAGARLGAAQKLQTRLAAIIEGEAPLDIFVRWKPLAEQPVGYHPDLNDGIRQNIRPFLLAGDIAKKKGAGLFRAVPLALKDKDRGTEPERPKKDYPWFWCEEEPGTDPTGGKDFVGNRWNGVHLTLARKRKARG